MFVDILCVDDEKQNRKPEAKMVLYRIQTEDKNRDGIEKTVSDFFDGYTVLSGTGFWKSDKEPTLVIEILAESASHNLNWANVKHIAEIIKESNNQECVLVTFESLVAEFV